MQFSAAFDPIRSFQAAWKLLKQAPLTVVIGGLLLMFLEGGGGGGSNFFYREHGFRGGAGLSEEFRQVFEEVKPWLLVLIPIALCVGIAFFALSSWLLIGFGRAIEFALRTSKDDLGKVFSGGDRFGAMLLGRFLSGLIQFAIALPLAGVILAAVLLSDRGGPDVVLVVGAVAFSLVWFVLALYVWLGLCLVTPIVALETCTPTDAIARSWKLASGHRLQLFWFWLFQVFLSIAGLCLCCIGLLLVSPLKSVMHFEAYISLTKGQQYPQWWIGTGKFPFDEHKPEDFSSPQQPPPAPPPLPPQS